MNEKEIVGYRHYSYISKKDGLKHDGYDVYLEWEEPGYVEGLRCEFANLKDTDLAGYVPHIGDVVRIGYNQWNRPCMVMLVRTADE